MRHNHTSPSLFLSVVPRRCKDHVQLLIINSKMVNVKTPNKKRKSFANAQGDSRSPKLDTSIKTPGKPKNSTTPVKPNKTPKTNLQQNNAAKTANTPNTPKQKPNLQQTNSVKKSNKKNKRSSESENENSPPKKLKMFSGTSDLQEVQLQKKQPVVKKEKKEQAEGKKNKRRSQFFSLRRKVDSGDKTALKDLEAKIKTIEDRKELTKTARRKLKYLQRLQRLMTGEESSTQAPSASKKRRERKKEAKAKQAGDTSQGENEKSEQQKGIKKAIVKKEVEEESDSSESDYEVDQIIKPDKIIKTEKEDSDDESGDDDEDDDDEENGSEKEEGDEDQIDDDESEEDSGEEEEVKPAKQQQGKKDQPNLKQLKESHIISKKQSRYIVFAGNLPYDATRQEISEHFKKAGEVRHIRIPNDKKTNKPRGFAYVEFHDEVSYQKALSLHHTFIKGRRINVLYTQGGKKKGDEKKNEVKAKNLKLQAMRKQGQLAGSIKENQKRSFRRNKNVKASVNGS